MHQMFIKKEQLYQSDTHPFPPLFLNPLAQYQSTKLLLKIRNFFLFSIFDDKPVNVITNPHKNLFNKFQYLNVSHNWYI